MACYDGGNFVLSNPLIALNESGKSLLLELKTYQSEANGRGEGRYDREQLRIALRELFSKIDDWKKQLDLAIRISEAQGNRVEEDIRKSRELRPKIDAARNQLDFYAQ